MKKRQITTDYLYDYWKEQHLTITVLASKMGVSESIVRGCFQHKPNRHGKPLHFSKTNLKKLNAALEQIAQELHDSIISIENFNPVENQRGTVYYPDTAKTINRLSTYFNMKVMMYELLKWKGNKCYNVLTIENSPVYGNVTREEIDRINTKLSSIAGTLRDLKVTGDN